MEEQIVNVNYSKHNYNFNKLKMVYSLSRMVLICVVFSILFSAVLSNSNDYKVLSLSIGFLLVIEFLRSVRW